MVAGGFAGCPTADAAKYAQTLAQSFTVKGRGWPVFKAGKTTELSLEYTQRGFSLRDGRLVLAKGVSIPVVWSRELPSAPTSVRVFQDSLGYWYASFVVRRTVDPAPATERTIGIDWGVRATATTTDPLGDLPYRGHRTRCAAELGRAQRKMARRLAKSAMARKASDAAIGPAKRELIERGMRAGRRVVLVRPYTTMTCSRCFARAEQRLVLAERIFRCRACGFTAGRDRNAARVILAVAERDHTRVDDVRQSDHLLWVAGGVAVRA